MTSFQSSELTELPVVENSQLFAQRTVRPLSFFLASVQRAIHRLVWVGAWKVSICKPSWTVCLTSSTQLCSTGVPPLPSKRPVGLRLPTTTYPPLPPLLSDVKGVLAGQDMSADSAGQRVKQVNELLTELQFRKRLGWAKHEGAVLA